MVSNQEALAAMVTLVRDIYQNSAQPIAACSERLRNNAQGQSESIPGIETDVWLHNNSGTLAIRRKASLLTLADGWNEKGYIHA